MSVTILSVLCGISFNSHNNTLTKYYYYPFLQLGKLSLSRVKLFAQGHTNSTCWSWDSKSDPKAYILNPLSL